MVSPASPLADDSNGRFEALGCDFVSAVLPLSGLGAHPAGAVTVGGRLEETLRSASGGRLNSDDAIAVAQRDHGVCPPKHRLLILRVGMPSAVHLQAGSSHRVS